MKPVQIPERKEIIYCAGPFSPTATHSQAQNIARAIEQGQRVRALGLVPLVPHAAILPDCTWQAGQDECLELVQHMDGLLLLEDWNLSPGALQERALAEALNLSVFDGLAALEAEAALGVPVTFAGRLRAFWRCLEVLAAREVAAGMPHPNQRRMLWTVKAGLWLIRVNPFPVAGQLRETGQVIPAFAAALEYAGQAVGILTMTNAEMRPDGPQLMPNLIKQLTEAGGHGQAVAS